MNAREETIDRLREQAEAEATEEPELPLEEEEEASVKPQAVREYIVFSLAAGNAWKEEARVSTGSAESAIKTLGEKLKNDAQYAACPSRNWSVGSPEVATTTKIKIKFQ